MSMVQLVELDDNNIHFFKEIIRENELKQFEDKELSGVGAIVNNQACGVAMVLITEESLYISWLYVLEEYRRQGVASAMLDTLIAIAKKNYVDIESTYSIDMENEALVAFLNHYNCIYIPTNTRISFSLSDLNVIPVDKKNIEMVVPLSRVSPIQFNKLKTEILESDGVDFYGVCNSLIDEFDNELSCVLVDDNNSIETAFFAFKPDDNGDIDIFYYWSNAPEKPSNMRLVLNYFAEECAKKGFDKNIKIRADILNDKILALTDKVGLKYDSQEFFEAKLLYGMLKARG